MMLSVMLVTALAFAGTQAQLRFQCTFETDLCGMVNDNQDSPLRRGTGSFDWERRTGGTPTGNTGPSGGFNSQYYLFIETSDPQRPGDTARIATQALNRRGFMCVQFSYHMYGQDMGSLGLYLQDGNSVSSINYLNNARINGDQGNVWKTARYTVNLPSETYRVGFIGTKGTDFRSDIGIDSILITERACDDNTGPPATVAPPEETINLPFTCSFESGICGLVQRRDDDFEWNRLNRNTDTTNTGPNEAQSGNWYLYTEASSPRAEGDRASIETLAISGSGMACLSFYYHAYGTHVRELQVYTKNRGVRNPWKTYTGDRGNQWLFDQVNVTLGSFDRVGFTGIRGSDIRGDIAIDNIRLEQGSCRTEGTTQQPEITTTAPPVTTRRTTVTPRPTTLAPTTRRMTTGTTRLTAPPTTRRVIKTRSPTTRPPTTQAPTTRHVTTRPTRATTQPLTKASDAAIILSTEDVDAGGTPSPTPRPTGALRTLPYGCSFESPDLCGMTQRSDDSFDWTRISGRTPTDQTGPNSARSGNYYIYIEASNRGFNSRAAIETPQLVAAGNTESDVCVSFFYNMYGSNIGRLIVYRSSRSEGQSIVSLNGNKGADWFQTSVTTRLAPGERIIFVAYTAGDLGDIAIDQLSINNGACSGGGGNGGGSTGPTTPSITDLFTCDMEGDGRNNGECRVRQDRGGDGFDWIRITGRTPSGAQFRRRVSNQLYPVTGPSGAQQGAYYLYVEASTRQANDVARLILEGSDFRDMRGSGGYRSSCLRFFYNMNGHHAGTLAVYVIKDGRKSYRWRLSGDQLVNWKQAAVAMDMSGVSQVGIEAVVKGKFNGDMALDDIRMSSSPCEATPSQYIYWCNFELNDGSSTWCRMDQETNDQYDWTIMSGETPSEETGPSRAFNGEWYMYAEASSPRTRGQQARILLPTLQQGGDLCVRFRYHMYGFHVNALEVFTLLGGSYRTRWTRAGNQGNQWFEASATIENADFNDRIGFRAIRGSEYSGDIAVDNIRVSRGRC